jgi:hypothetical protein
VEKPVKWCFLHNSTVSLLVQKNYPSHATSQVLPPKIQQHGPVLPPAIPMKQGPLEAGTCLVCPSVLHSGWGASLYGTHYANTCWMQLWPSADWAAEQVRSGGCVTNTWPPLVRQVSTKVESVLIAPHSH